MFGETGDEMGEVYYYYGRSLLEISRLESGILGNALIGVDMDNEDAAVNTSQVEDPEAMTKEEKEDVKEKVADALEENFEKHDFLAKVHMEVESEEDDAASMSQEETEELDVEKATITEESEKEQEDSEEEIFGLLGRCLISPR